MHSSWFILALFFNNHHINCDVISIRSNECIHCTLFFVSIFIRFICVRFVLVVKKLRGVESWFSLFTTRPATGKVIQVHLGKKSVTQTQVDKQAYLHDSPIFAAMWTLQNSKLDLLITMILFVCSVYIYFL